MPFGAFLESCCTAQNKVSHCTGNRMVELNKQLASRMPFIACLVFFCEAQRRVKPHDAPSLVQQRVFVNMTAWLAYKRLPDPPWKHKVSQTDLLHDTNVDWPFLADTLVHVQVFGHTGDRTVKLHK